MEKKRRSRNGCAKKWRLLGKNCMIIQFEWTSNGDNGHTNTDQANILSDRLSDWILLITFGFVYFIHRQHSFVAGFISSSFRSLYPSTHCKSFSFFFFTNNVLFYVPFDHSFHLLIHVKHNGLPRKLAFKTNLFSLFNWHLSIVCLSFYKWKRPKQFMNQIKSNPVEEKKTWFKF